jgi:hypothetical protein
MHQQLAQMAADEPRPACHQDVLFHHEIPPLNIKPGLILTPFINLVIDSSVYGIGKPLFLAIGTPP